MPSQHAILFGVSQFEDRSIASLPCAANDAMALGKALRELGFASVRVFADAPGAEGPPTYINIHEAILDAQKLLKPDDTFVLAGATHGVQREGTDRRYLLTRDTPARDPSRGIALDVLNDWLMPIEALQRVLMLDLCRDDPNAGRGGSANLMTDALSRDISLLGQLPTNRSDSRSEPTTYILNACRAGERAFEWPGMGHGLFTYYLLQGLREGAWKGNELELITLGDYVRERIEEWCKKDGTRRQTPDLGHNGPPRRVVLGSRKKAVDRDPITPQQLVRHLQKTLGQDPEFTPARFENLAQLLHASSPLDKVDRDALFMMALRYAEKKIPSRAFIKFLEDASPKRSQDTRPPPQKPPEPKPADPTFAVVPTGPSGPMPSPNLSFEDLRHKIELEEQQQLVAYREWLLAEAAEREKEKHVEARRHEEIELANFQRRVEEIKSLFAERKWDAVLHATKSLSSDRKNVDLEAMKAFAQARAIGPSAKQWVAQMNLLVSFLTTRWNVEKVGQVVNLLEVGMGM